MGKVRVHSAAATSSAGAASSSAAGFGGGLGLSACAGASAFFSTSCSSQGRVICDSITLMQAGAPAAAAP